MYALTAKSKGKHRGATRFSGESAFVLPRLLRRPVRFASRLVQGDVYVSPKAGNLLSVGFIGACALYGSILGGQFQSGVGAVTSAAGLGVSEIKITGNTFTGPVDVYRALELSAGSSLVTLNVADAKAALLQLPWVSKATLRKEYPSTLTIDMSERQPYALWQMGEAIAVVESDGNVIGGFAADPRLAQLPLIVGVGAAEHGKSIIDQVVAFPEISRRVHAYMRVGDRRWNLRLANGLTLKLPEADVDDALVRLLAMDAQLDVTERDLAAIDLRQRDRTVFALTENAATDRAEAVKARAEAMIKRIKGAPI